MKEKSKEKQNPSISQLQYRKERPQLDLLLLFNWRPHFLLFSIELNQPLGRIGKWMNNNATVVACFVIWGMLRIFRRLLVKPRSCFDGQGAERAKKALCSLMPSIGRRCNYAEQSGFRFRWRRAQYGISQKNILDVKAGWMNAGDENNNEKKSMMEGGGAKTTKLLLTSNSSQLVWVCVCVC